MLQKAVNTQNRLLEYFIKSIRVEKQFKISPAETM